MRHLVDWGGSVAAAPVTSGGFPAQPPAPDHSSFSSHSTDSGWGVSRAVLYFFIIFLALAWASACICFARHCIRRRRVSEAVGQGERRRENGSTDGGVQSAGPAPRYFKPEIPVIIVGPDNSFDLGVKDEQACGAGATSAAAASWQAGGAQGNQHPLKALRAPRRAGLGLPSSEPGQQAVSPPNVIARQRGSQGLGASQEGAQRHHDVQLAQAGVWLPRQRDADEDDDTEDDSSAFEGRHPRSSSSGSSRAGSTSGHDSASSSSGGGTSRDAAGAWGYEASGSGR